MQSISKQEIADLLSFVEKQTAFIIRTTRHIKTYHDFLLSDTAMVLFNSTCMCLQTIGETIRQIDNRTQGLLFLHYKEIPWKQIIGMRNIISHEYLSIDPELVFSIVQEELPPLLDTLRQVIDDLDAGKYNQDIKP